MDNKERGEKDEIWMPITYNIQDKYNQINHVCVYKSNGKISM